ncbi:MAG TPA: fatty acid desaturase [Vicinamibacterales bacterium]|nr:fatty acid desaturase [Vicinamibacterales bacterium]
MSIVAHAAAAPSRLTQPREAIASFRRRHAWWASTWVTVDLGLYLALLIAVVYTPPACRPLVSIALAFVIARLFVLGHDACHGSMFASRRANQIVGRLTFLPSFTPFSLWDLAHNRTHHAFTNLKGYDYVWTPMSLTEYRAAPRWRRVMERVYRTVPGHGLYYAVEIYRAKLIFPSRAHVPEPRPEYRRDSLAVTAFAAVQLAGYAAAAHLTRQPAWSLVAFGVALPFVLWNALMGFAIFLHHTHPDVAWFDDLDQWRTADPQLRNSVHVVLPFRLDAWLHHIMDHTAHHIDPLIPLFELPDAQGTLEQHFDARVHTWTPAVFLNTVRICKLYDYDAHRWLDFKGRITAELRGVRRRS